MATLQGRLDVIEKLRQEIAEGKKEFKSLRAEALKLRDAYRSKAERVTKILALIREDCEHDDVELTDVKGVQCRVCTICEMQFPVVSPNQPTTEVPEVGLESQPGPEPEPIEISRGKRLIMREALPSWLIPAWQSDAQMWTVLSRMRDDAAFSKFEPDEFDSLFYAVVGQSVSWANGLTVRQFVAKNFSAANNLLWDRAKDQNVVFAMRKALGFRDGKVTYMVSARGLTSNRIVG